MGTVSHREMRNNSGEILRRASGGETIQVTNHGQIVAVIVPPGTDPITDLANRGQLRVARRPLSDLLTIERRKSSLGSAELVDDARRPW